MWELLKENQKSKFLFYCYNLGKEELFVNLAKEFDTRIAIAYDWYQRVKAIFDDDLDQYFVLVNKDDGYFEDF